MYIIFKHILYIRSIYITVYYSILQYMTICFMYRYTIMNTYRRYVVNRQTVSYIEDLHTFMYIVDVFASFRNIKCFIMYAELWKWHVFTVVATHVQLIVDEMERFYVDMYVHQADSNILANTVGCTRNSRKVIFLRLHGATYYLTWHRPCLITLFNTNAVNFGWRPKWISLSHKPLDGMWLHSSYRVTSHCCSLVIFFKLTKITILYTYLVRILLWNTNINYTQVLGFTRRICDISLICDIYEDILKF